jgi:hypothetical protein
MLGAIAAVLENLAATGLVWGTRRLGDLLNSARDEVEQAGRVALVDAARRGVREGRPDPEWVADAFAETLGSSDTRASLVGVAGERDGLPASELGSRLFAALSPRFKEDMVEAGVDVRAVVDAFGERFWARLRQAAESKGSKLANLVDRMEYDALRVGLDRIEARVDPLRSAFSPSGGVVAHRVEALIDTVTDHVVGRDEDLRTIDRIVGDSAGMLIVTGESGFGKTALLAEWVRTRKGVSADIAYHFFSERHQPYLTDRTEGIHALTGQLAQLAGAGDRADLERAGSLDDMMFSLVEEVAQHAAQRPVVVVIDAIDEAESFGDPPVPLPLPANVTLIVSLRLGRNEQSPLLKDWAESAPRLHATPLGRDAVDHYLRDLEIVLSEEQLLLLHERTAGYPLYLRYLSQDLRQAQEQCAEIDAILAVMPSTFVEYARGQVDRIFERAPGGYAYRLLGALAIAEAPLPVPFAAIAAGMDEARLEEAARNPAVRRWVRRGAGSPETLALDHPLLREPFGEKLPDQVKRSRAMILDYARDSSATSPYLLRHYVKHLADAASDEPGRVEELLAVAADPTFLAAQEAEFPDDPSLPASTVKAALIAVAEQPQPLRFAEWLSRYHAQLSGLASETPMRAGVPLRAWRLVEIAPLIAQPIWLLELAHRYQQERSTENVEEALARLSALQLRSSGNLEQVAQALVDDLGLSDDVRYKLRAQVLSERSAVGDFIAHGDVTEALGLLGTIEAPFEQTAAIGELIASVGEAGLETAEAVATGIPRDVLGLVARTIATALADVREARVVELASAGQLDQAARVAEGESDAGRRARALARVARGWAELGRQSDAETTFAAAQASAEAAEFQSDRALALAVVSAQRFKSGFENDARAGFERAYAAAWADANASTRLAAEVLYWQLAAGADEPADSLGHIEAALAELEPGTADTDWLHLSNVLSAAGQHERAKHAATQVVDPERRLLLMLARGEEEQGDAAGAEGCERLVAMFDEIDRVADPVARTKLWISAYRRLSAEAHLREQAVARRRARKCADELVQPQQRADALLELGLAEWLLGNREQARTAFCAGLETLAMSPTGVRPAHALADAISSLTEVSSIATYKRCAKVGFQQAAMILDDDERSAALWHLCAACAGAGHPELAEQCTERFEASPPEGLLESGLQEGTARRVRKLISARRYDAARALADGVQRLAERIRWHIAVAKAERDGGDVSYAADAVNVIMGLIDELEAAEDKATALIALADLMTSDGDTEGAERAFADARGEIVRNVDVTHSPYLLGSLAEALMANDRPVEASATFAEARELAALDREGLEMLCVGLTACCRARYLAGDSRGANRDLEEAVRIVRSVDLPHEAARALTAIGEAAATVGDRHGSRVYFEQALKRALEDESVSLGGGGLPDRLGRTSVLVQTTPPSSDILGELAEAAARSGFKELAERALDRGAAVIADRPDGLARLGRAVWTVRGQVAGTAAFAAAEARAVARHEPGQLVRAYCDIADEVARIGDEQVASKLLTQALEVANATAAGPAKAFALALVAASAHRARDDDTARRLLGEAEAVANSGRTSFDRVAGLLEVAEGYAACGNSDTAEAVLRRAEEEATPEELAKVQHNLVQVLAARGDQRAQSVAADIDDDRLRSLAYTDLERQSGTRLAEAIESGPDVAEVIRMVDEQRPSYWIRQALGSAVVRLAAAGAPDEAMALLTAITRDAHNDATQELLVRELTASISSGHDREPPGLEQRLTDAITAAGQLESGRRGDALRTIALVAQDANAQSTFLSTAEKALHEVEGEATIHALQIRVAIAAGLAKAGEATRAISLATAIDRELGGSDATTAVAKALISAGAPGNALNAALSAQYERQACLLAVATALSEASFRGEAAELMLAAADDPAWAPDILATLVAMHPDCAEDLAILLVNQIKPASITNSAA